MRSLLTPLVLSVNRFPLGELTALRSFVLHPGLLLTATLAGLVTFSLPSKWFWDWIGKILEVGDSMFTQPLACA